MLGSLPSSIHFFSRTGIHAVEADDDELLRCTSRRRAVTMPEQASEKAAMTRTASASAFMDFGMEMREL